MRFSVAERWFAALAGASALWLALTLVPGVFTIDECNHLAAVAALRHGRLTLPGYEGISPSTELAFFNPRKSGPPASPPVNELPPLYAFFALPFSVLGFRGLFVLNAVAFATTLLIVFFLVRRRARDREMTPWLAAGAFALGGHCLEYAQGMWPHMLSVCLCTAGFALASSARQGPTAGRQGRGRTGALRSAGSLPAVAAAFLAGLLLGAATGVRYQNIVYAAGVGLGLGLWARPRRRTLAGYAAGLGLPLGIISVLNYLRLGSFNPVSKGPGYLAFVGPARAGRDRAVEGGLAALGGFVAWLKEVGETFWYRVVDYSACPAIGYGDFFPRPSSASGAYLFYGVVKKAWLQSSPWVAVALVSLMLVWFGKHAGRGGGGADAPRAADEDPIAGELRAISLVVWPVLLMFAFLGVRRNDGICFNQRYFLELVPLVSVALALLVERRGRSRAVVCGAAPLGAAAGLALGFGVLGQPAGAAREVALLQAPLWLAGGALLVWGAAGAAGTGAPARRARKAFFSGIATAFVVGACLGWSFAVHLGEDVRTVRKTRAFIRERTDDLRRKLPDHSAVLTWTYARNAAAPLILERDVLIIDASRDRARDASMLVAQLLKQGRRVFLIKNFFEWEIRTELVAEFGVAGFQSGLIDLLELGGTAGRRDQGKGGDGPDR